MASCGKCGKENPHGMLFCTSCGNSLPDVSSSGSRSSGPESVETLVLNQASQSSPSSWPDIGAYNKRPTAPEPVKSRAGLIIGIVAAVLLIVLVGAGAAGVYFYSKSRDNSADGNTNQGVSSPSTVGDSNENSNANKKPTPTPTPANTQLFSPPTEPTKDASFTVYANGDWQLSQIAVVPRESYRTSVEGIVDLAGAKAGVRSSGTKDAEFKSRRLFAEWPTGALLMRTRYADGRFSNTVAVTAGASGSWQNLPDERGMLEFRINDNQQQSNGGQFTIRKRHTSVPKS